MPQTDRGRKGRNVKRLLTVQDISCVGKCSLTVALPIISVMGVEACPLPTALLSGHTAFSHFSFRDLTGEIPKIEDAWEKEGIRFDTIESGYLGSIRQIELVRELGRKFRRNTDCLQIVDPAMADGGRLYTGFTQEFVTAMKALCRDADVVVPNLTEACLLTGRTYREDADPDFWGEVLEDLSGLGCRDVIVTGFRKADGIGVMSLHQENGKKIVDTYLNERLPESFHGTGDIFASVLSGALTLGWPLQEAQKLAVDYTLECIRRTMEDPQRRFYGVNFEQALPMLQMSLHSATGGKVGGNGEKKV